MTKPKWKQIAELEERLSVALTLLSFVRRGIIVEQEIDDFLINSKNYFNQHIYVEGNKGGDFIELNHTEGNMINLKVAHCCVYMVDNNIPVEVLTALLASKFDRLEGVFEVIDETWGNGPDKSFADLLKSQIS